MKTRITESLTITRRTLLMAMGAAALYFPLPSFAVPPPSPSPIRDLMPAFWLAYDPVSERSVEEQSAALVTGFFGPQAEVYERAGIHKTDAATVARWLSKISDIIPGMRQLHRRFAGDYASYVTKFQQMFPDFDKEAAPTFLMPSLLHFDAHLEPSRGELPLFFGADGIVRFHGPDADLGVLFAHETFHCYQGQRNPAVMLAPKDPLYSGLWIEGGATWVSERLNPHASRLAILLDDHALESATRAQQQAAARALLAKFDSTEDADMAPFFDAGWTGAWPARIGYLIGLEIARKLGGSMPIERFAQLSLADMRPLYEREVEAIAAGRA